MLSRGGSEPSVAIEGCTHGEREAGAWRGSAAVGRVGREAGAWRVPWEGGGGGASGAGKGCLGLGFEPLTLKGSTAWCARLCAHLCRAFSSPSFTWAARGVWSSRSLSARTASGSHVVVASPQQDFRV